ncbi:MAG: response regulator transcription factor [Chloroflexota bacterium]
MSPIRLMLVDDHDVVRTGLRTLLQEYADLQVVAEAGNGNEALKLYSDTHPDVVVMDITMPDMDGLEATEELRTLYPESKILALTVHEDKQYFFEMLGKGASGYVSKRVAADELVSAIKAVAAGHVYLQPALARWLIEDYHRVMEGYTQKTRPPGEITEDEKGIAALSQREREVLELVAEGYTSPQIGERLGISSNTVNRHRERIMVKLNMHSVSELIKFAIRTGLISLE